MSKTKELKNAHNWKHLARWHGDGYYALQTDDIGEVPVRLFLTPNLLNDAEETLYRQIVNATRFPGTKLVVITPDTHYGYGVPVGCVLLTDAEEGAIAMGPVGYDIGCFTADTLVPTMHGVLSIGNLVEMGEEIPVYSWSEKDGVVTAVATAKKTRANAPLVKVKLDNDREITCTPDHEFLLIDGTYRQAQALTDQISLKSFEPDDVGFTYYTPPGRDGQAPREKAFKVVSVESLDYTEDVYCLTVPEYGNFALDAGVFVHNCGMVSAKSEVEAEAATADKRLAFNRAVMRRVSLGAGGKSVRLKNLDRREFDKLIRGGAEYYVEKYGAAFDRSRAERHRLPVDDDWQAPLGGKGQPERGIEQLGSLGGGKSGCLPVIAI